MSAPKSCVLPLFLTAIGSAPAFGQSSDHAGNSLTLGLSKSKFNNQMAQDGGPSSVTWGNVGKVRLEHLRPLDDRWLIGVTASFNLSDLKATRTGGAGTPVILDFMQSNDNYTYTPGGSSTTRLSQQLGAGLQLGYALSKSQLVLGSLSLHRAKATVSGAGGAGTYSESCTWDESLFQACLEAARDRNLLGAGGANPGSATLNGYGLGLGYRHQLQANWFVQFDAQQIFYRKNEGLNIKPGVTEINLGVGYRF